MASFQWNVIPVTDFFDPSYGDSEPIRPAHPAELASRLKVRLNGHKTIESAGAKNR